MIELQFPWPPRELSPNWRGHWSKKAKAAKKYKIACLWVCALVGPYWRKPEHPRFTLIFCPPSARRADLDNMLASFKSGLDAIAIWLCIDDSKFTYTISKAEPVKNGAVRVTIS